MSISTHIDYVIMICLTVRVNHVLSIMGFIHVMAMTTWLLVYDSNDRLQTLFSSYRKAHPPICYIGIYWSPLTTITKVNCHRFSQLNQFVSYLSQVKAKGITGKWCYIWLGCIRLGRDIGTALVGPASQVMAHYLVAMCRLVQCEVIYCHPIPEKIIRQNTRPNLDQNWILNFDPDLADWVLLAEPCVIAQPASCSLFQHWAGVPWLFAVSVWST